jgi:hypothetical protein
MRLILGNFLEEVLLYVFVCYINAISRNFNPNKCWNILFIAVVFGLDVSWI